MIIKDLEKYTGDISGISVHPETMSQNRSEKLLLLPANSIFPLPDNMKEHLTAFVKLVKDELPDKMIYKDMGLGTMDTSTVLGQLKKLLLEK